MAAGAALSPSLGGGFGGGGGMADLPADGDDDDIRMVWLGMLARSILVIEWRP